MPPSPIAEGMSVATRAARVNFTLTELEPEITAYLGATTEPELIVKSVVKAIGVFSSYPAVTVSVKT